MILTNLSTRMSTADPAPASVVFEAPGPSSHPVLWRATYPHNPLPDECANPACRTGESTRLGRDETPPARWAGNPTDGVSEQSNSPYERTTQ